MVLNFFSCNVKQKEKENQVEVKTNVAKQTKAAIIIDSNYSFEDAIKGSKAPKELLGQLQLITVLYYSLDHKLHQGQILTNKLIANDIENLFEFILQSHFPIAKAIPIVRYDWNDDLSMQDNNTYSFCYRNVSFSKHAKGMAIDINPFFNPVRWKNDSIRRQDKPIGANYDPSVPGTFFSDHPVVRKSKKLGFRWGHAFSKKYDDHHFEK